MGIDKMTEYYILLQHILGIGSKSAKKIIEKFGSADAVFSADYNDLKLSGLFSEKMISKISDADIEYSRKVLNDCNELGVAVIPYGSLMYPELLSKIPDAPLVLYAKGNLKLFQEPLICVVGQRKVSAFGKKAAFSLAARLAAGGFTVVSGGAVGSDTAAHLGALAVNGNTICVYPSGINSDYLKTNKSLREKIAQNGLVVSECPPGTPLGKGMIPIRNRIMSGLCVATVVTEAPLKSGALITADMALEQNRDVYAVPGNASDADFEGSNKLIDEGAVSLTDARIIFEEYAARYKNKINTDKAYEARISVNMIGKIPDEVKKTDNLPKAEKIPENAENSPKKINLTLSKSAQIVYNNLDKHIFSIDDIRNGELNSSQLIAAVTELEIKKVIKALPGGRYEKIQ